MNIGIVCYNEVKKLLKNKETPKLSKTVLVFIDFVLTL